MPHVAPCMRGIYLRPILGHTPRKLPLRASPQSNLSLHRISSPIIIQHLFQKCNRFFIFFMTIFNEFFINVLYILHNFAWYFGLFRPFCAADPGKNAYPYTARAIRSTAFLCTLLKAQKNLYDLSFSLQFIHNHHI